MAIDLSRKLEVGKFYHFTEAAIRRLAKSGTVVYLHTKRPLSAHTNNVIRTVDIPTISFIVLEDYKIIDDISNRHDHCNYHYRVLTNQGDIGWIFWYSYDFEPVAAAADTTKNP